MSQYCPNCGAQLDDNDRFCGKCGEPLQSLEDFEARPAYSRGQNDSREHNKSGGVKKVAVVLVLMAIVAAFILPFVPAPGYIGNFKIEGSWKSTSQERYDGIAENAIITFDGRNCNVLTPLATYAFYKERGKYYLDCTSIFNATYSAHFSVEIVDKNNIKLIEGRQVIPLKRVS